MSAAPAGLSGNREERSDTHDGCPLRLTTPIDEFTRKCLAIQVARRINAIGISETLADPSQAMMRQIIGTPLRGSISW